MRSSGARSRRGLGRGSTAERGGNANSTYGLLEFIQADRVVFPVPRFFRGAIIQGGQRMVLISYVLASLHRDEEGQGLAEYALILALIAIVAIVALLFLGGKISTTLSKVGGSL